MSANASLFEIFAIVSMSTIFSLGGGNGALTVIQDRWVTTKMLDPSLFAWALALGYLSPGPKAGFLSGIGYFMAGVPGACAAIAGIIVPTCIGSAGMTYAYNKLEPVIKRVTVPASFVVAGMIAAAAWQTAAPMHLKPVEIGAVAGVALLVGWRNLEPYIVVLGAAAAGIAWWLIGY
jgi:chromate transporter